MHGEQASLPIAAAGQGQQQYALYSEQNAAHAQDESIENLRQYGGDLGQSQQLENQMMHQMASQMLPAHQALQSMSQADGQDEVAGDEPGSFPQLEFP